MFRSEFRPQVARCGIEGNPAGQVDAIFRFRSIFVGYSKEQGGYKSIAPKRAAESCNDNVKHETSRHASSLLEDTHRVLHGDGGLKKMLCLEGEWCVLIA